MPSASRLNPKCKEQIENATVDAATVKEHSVSGCGRQKMFSVSSWKRSLLRKEPAGKALLGLLGLALNSEKPVPIGYFKGMELQIQHLPFGNEYHARLAGSGTYSTQLGADVLGNLTRLSNWQMVLSRALKRPAICKSSWNSSLPAPRKKSSGHFHRQRN